MKYLNALIFSSVFIVAAANAGPEHNHGKHHYQKPGAAVVVASDSVYRIEAGESKLVDLSLHASANAGTASVEIRLDKGLQLVDGETSLSFDLKNGKKLDIPLNIYAESNGRYFVHVFTTIVDEAGQSLSRAQAIAIDVGDQQKKLFKTNGQKYRVMPVKEEII